MRRILGRGLAVLLSVAAGSAPAQPETMRPETVGEGTPEAARPGGGGVRATGGAVGHAHKKAILEALRAAGFDARECHTNDFYN